jgi:ADP-heptose:LPS heptosyltransferase
MRFLISILTFRMESGVRNCVDSVVRGGGNFKLHLTANGNEAAWKYFGKLGKRPSDCEVVCNDTNLGFIPPNNRAMAYAQKHGFDVLVTLNDDATVPHGWLAAIEAEFDRHPSAAIVGAQGVCRSLTSDYHGFNGASLEFIEGSCAAYRVSVWKKHFKTLYPSGLRFAYGEDSSVSLEVRRLGYTIHQANFTIEHNRGSTSKHVPEAKISQEENHKWALNRYAHYLKHRTFAHRIIVKRKYSAGDVLLLTPVIRELWRTHPLCKIFYEGNFPELFAGNPCVEHACQQMDRQATDLVFNFDMVSENSPLRHFAASYARAAGVEIEPPYRLEIYWKEDRWRDLDWSGKWVALHTGPSTWPAKEWSVGKWIVLMDELAEDGWNIVTVGTGLLKGLNAYPAIPTKLRDARDATKSLNELAALLSHVSLFIGLDSAPLHVSQAVGIPSIGLFGITSSKYILTAPNAIGIDADESLYPRAGERHRVVGQTMVHESGETINSITVDQVIEAVEKLTGKKVNA